MKVLESLFLNTETVIELCKTQQQLNNEEIERRMWGHPSSSSNLWVCSWRTVLSSRQGISICHFLLLLCLWDKSALLSLIPGLFPFTVFLHCSFPKLHLKKKPHSLRDSFSLEVISPVILDQNPLNCHLKSLSFVFFRLSPIFCKSCLLLWSKLGLTWWSTKCLLHKTL